MNTQFFAALVVSLMTIVHLSTGSAIAGAPRPTASTPAPAATTPASSEVYCEVHGQGFFSRAPAARRNDRRPAASIESLSAANIPTWKSITIGMHANSRALRDALRQKRCRIGELASEALDQVVVASGKLGAKLNLSVLSVAELGFGSKGASFTEIYARAIKLGLELCPAEIGPQLRLQYMNQRLGEFLHVAMEPIAIRQDKPVVFVVANGGEGLLLISSDASPDLIVPSATRFVFVRPQAVAAR